MERDHPQRTLEKEKMKDLGGSGLSCPGLKRTAASFSSTHRAPGHCVRGSFSFRGDIQRTCSREERKTERKASSAYSPAC